jgi:arginase
MTSAAGRIDLIGVPFNSAGTSEGVARAPAALRRAGLIEALVAAEVHVRDAGDLSLPYSRPDRDPASHVIGVESILMMIARVRDAVTTSLDRGAFPLILGGDCPVLIGCLAAAREHASARVLFVDGHEDAWPAARSMTGEAADMELGWLLGRTLEGLPFQLRREIPMLESDDVVVLGARDDEEIASAGVASIGDQVRIVGPEAIASDPASVAQDVISSLNQRGHWWLHVDLDVLSTDSLASVDYRQAGGLSWSTLIDLTRDALASRRVIGWDVTIYNPDLDPRGIGAKQIVRYVADAFSAARIEDAADDTPMAHRK